MQLSQNFPCPKQLALNFDNSSPKPVIWQWNDLSPQVREVVLELAVFNAKTITTLSKQEVVEPWMQCTLNWTMELVSKGWVDLRFDDAKYRSTSSVTFYQNRLIAGRSVCNPVRNVSDPI